MPITVALGVNTNMKHETFIIALSSILIFSGCDFDKEEFYSATQSQCNMSCGFDVEALKECYEQPAVIEYTISGFDAFDKASDMALKNVEFGSCICLTAEIDKNGMYSNLSYLNDSQGFNGGLFIKIINLGNVAPIPENASCILEEKNKTIPMSFVKGAKS